MGDREAANGNDQGSSNGGSARGDDPPRGRHNRGRGRDQDHHGSRSGRGSPSGDAHSAYRDHPKGVGGGAMGDRDKPSSHGHGRNQDRDGSRPSNSSRSRDRKKRRRHSSHGRDSKKRSRRHRGHGRDSEEHSRRHRGRNRDSKERRRRRSHSRGRDERRLRRSKDSSHSRAPRGRRQRSRKGTSEQQQPPAPERRREQPPLPPRQLQQPPLPPPPPPQQQQQGASTQPLLSTPAIGHPVGYAPQPWSLGNMGGYSLAHYPLAQAPQAQMLHQPQSSSTVYSGQHGAALTHHLRPTPWMWRPSPNAQTPQPAGVGPPQTATHPGVGEPISPKEAQRVVNKIVSDMGMSKGQDGFVGLVVDPQGELSWRNDPVLFVDKFTKTTAQVEGTAWAMPQDQFSTDGINPARPRADRLTPWRVECFGKLSADTLATRDLMRPHTTVEVPLVQGGLCHIPFEEVTAKEWCRMLVAEVAHSGQAQRRAAVALDEIRLLQGESWMAAARRLVLHVRAATADETRPHASEEAYFWRYVSGRQVAELCERAVNLFFASASDRNGMESLLVQVGTDVKRHLTPVHVEPGKPLSDGMVRRGVVSHGIFYGIVEALLTRCSRYPLATTPAGRSRGSVAVLSQSQRLPLGPGGASDYPPREERRGGGKPPTREPPRAWRKKVEALRDSACAALAAVDGGLFSEEEEEEEDETLGNRPHVAAFANVRASTPGAHGTPFVSRKGGRDDRPYNRSREKADNRKEGEELPSPEAEDRVIIDALRQRRVCFFHARGSECPHKDAATGRECRFSHDEDVVPYGLYPRKNTPTQGPQLEPGMLTALEMLSAYTGDEGGASAGAPQVSRA